MFLLLFLLATFALIYYLYRRMRGPVYWPGAVSRAAALYPSQFDDPILHKQTTHSTWTMPNSIQIHHQTIPSCSPNPIHVLCVHGGPAIAPARPWKTCSQPSLTSHLTFHYYHQRGCGLSTRPFHHYPSKNFYPGCLILEQVLGLAAQIADIERARRRLGVPRIALLGHSFGALVATMYAAEFPQNVSSLVLVTPPSMLHMPQKHFNLFKAMRDSMTSEEDRRNMDRFVKDYLAFGKLPKLNDLAVTKLHACFAEQFRKACPDMFLGDELSLQDVGGWAAYATYMSLGMEYDYRSVLKRMLRSARFRTVVVNGSDDLVPIMAGEPYAALFPKGTVEQKVVKGGHFLLDEVPGELANAIREVLLSRPRD